MNQAAEQQKNDKFREVVGPQPKGVWLVLSTVGLLLIVAGTIIPIFQGFERPYWAMSRWFAYVYAAGAVVLFVSRLFAPYKGKNLRVKRLYRLETWSSVFFIVASFFLFYELESSRNWLAFTLAGGAIQVYTSIMIPRTIRKALKEDR